MMILEIKRTSEGFEWLSALINLYDGADSDKDMMLLILYERKRSRRLIAFPLYSLYIKTGLQEGLLHPI